MYICVCVHTHLLVVWIWFFAHFFLTGIQILEISSSSHSRRGNKAQISPFSAWNPHERPLLTESDPICGRSCCTRRQNSGFRSGTVCGSNESNTSIHLHCKSHPETKPSASYSSWSVKNPKIPAKASLENPHEAIIDNFTRQYFSSETKKLGDLSSLDAHREAGAERKSRVRMESVTGTCRMIVILHGKFGGSALRELHFQRRRITLENWAEERTACARITDPSAAPTAAAHSRSRFWRVQKIDGVFWLDPLRDILHLTDVIRFRGESDMPYRHDRDIKHH